MSNTKAPRLRLKSIELVPLECVSQYNPTADARKTCPDPVSPVTGGAWAVLRTAEKRCTITLSSRRWAPSPCRWGAWCGPHATEGGVMMMRPRTFSVIVCAGALLVLSGAAVQELVAQSAVITGKVTGKAGESLGGATVSIAEVGVAIAPTTAGVQPLTIPAEPTK